MRGGAEHDAREALPEPQPPRQPPPQQPQPRAAPPVAVAQRPERQGGPGGPSAGPARGPRGLFFFFLLRRPPRGARPHSPRPSPTHRAKSGRGGAGARLPLPVGRSRMAAAEELLAALLLLMTTAAGERARPGGARPGGTPFPDPPFPPPPRSGRRWEDEGGGGAQQLRVSGGARARRGGYVSGVSASWECPPPAEAAFPPTSLLSPTALSLCPPPRLNNPFLPPSNRLQPRAAPAPPAGEPLLNGPGRCPQQHRLATLPCATGSCMGGGTPWGQLGQTPDPLLFQALRTC